MSAPAGLWFAAVQCHGAADFTTANVKAAAGYALNYGGKVILFEVDRFGHRVTTMHPRDPREAVALWATVDAGADA